ncbi:MAG: pyruvate, water dikinase regulatory protein [Motiliproteus sp.]
MARRTIFYISDGTGITAVGLGRSLLSQFKQVEFERITLPYVDTLEKVDRIVAQIEARAQLDAQPPLLIYTLAAESIRQRLQGCSGYHVDLFGVLIPGLAEQLQQPPANSPGESRANENEEMYRLRGDAVNFTLDNDDGGRHRDYDHADIILTGVSRTGKTPTSLYLALQFGIRTANYPLTSDDLDETQLPKALRNYRHKLYGLTIDADLLAAIRQQRRPDSPYASIRQCYREVDDAQAMLQLNRVPILDVSNLSIEEVATRIIADTGLKRRFK